MRGRETMEELTIAGETDGDDGEEKLDAADGELNVDHAGELELRAGDGMGVV